ncbi:MAG: orotidine-5'-phosphate decarboxylase [Blastocatellia bacterium]|nr:orotidine-5'-phosphate decarboxylase [Blastocatellia bacterium]
MLDLKVNNPIIVALDLSDADQALALVDRLHGLVGMFKVGKQLFTAAGPAVVRRIIEQGERVFLDLKFHDIPSTVAQAGIEAARLGVSIFNLHALGGSQMMRAAVEAVDRTVADEKIARPLILGVTVLTSHTQTSLNEVGIERELQEQVVSLSQLCEAAGIDGVVASPREILPIRKSVKRPGFIILTPGVRPAGTNLDDQSRVMTPLEAIRAGADYLVLGRPITGATNPVSAAQEILAEIEPEIVRDLTKK